MDGFDEFSKNCKKVFKFFFCLYCNKNFIILINRNVLLMDKK